MYLLPEVFSNQGGDRTNNSSIDKCSTLHSLGTIEKSMKREFDLAEHKNQRNFKSDRLLLVAD